MNVYNSTHFIILNNNKFLNNYFELFPSEIFQQKYMLKSSVNNKHVRCTSHVWNELFLLKQEHVSS